VFRAILKATIVCTVTAAAVLASALASAAEPPTAGDSEWWSFAPICRPPLPTVKAATWPRGAIDRFILAALEGKGFMPSPEADRRTLVRRLYFDLIGLPPAPKEVDAFVADADPQAYEKLVDRLLESPHYGERWARHWLDVARYGETHGYDKDKPRPNAWPYRDYVIRAFNADKPYYRFVQEQIAGDALYPGTTDGVEALGFIAAGPWDFIGHAELGEDKIDGKIARHLDRDDMVAGTINAFMSLTVHCAACHDHRFDPISQEDYYSLQAVFAALDRADKPYYEDPDIARQHAELLSRQRELDARLKTASAQAKADVTKQLAGVAAELKKLPHPRLVYAATVHRGEGSFAGTGASGGRPREIRVLARGDVTRPGKLVAPGAIAAVRGPSSRFELRPDHDEGERRAALARWISDRENPLTWRSIVNRVWLYHFGRGIVDTPSDFGQMGDVPSHPELLDWLAVEFRDGGQSLKRLHRLIVTSATYRQTSSVTQEATAMGATARDAGNVYYWRMNRRRLEAEAIRDSILEISGKLERTLFGPSFQDFVIEKPEHSPHYKYHLHDPNDPRSHRRSVYRFLVRSQQQPFMAALDCADPSMAIDKRNHTVTPHAALAVLNNQRTVAMAPHFAARVEKSAAGLDAQVTAAVRLALGRAPSPMEHERLGAYAREHGLANMCRLIFNLNEFAFVD
jgi:hypothetical protein